MEAQARSSHKYVVLQVWCGLLTVAMVIMAALFTSIKLKSPEDKVSSVKTEYAHPTANMSMIPSKLIGSSFSYIQLVKSQDGHSWTAEHQCESCALTLHEDSIYCSKSGLYFLYAQVTFSRRAKKDRNKSVILKRNASEGKIEKSLVDGTFPPETEGSVWVAKIVSLKGGNSVSLEINDDILKENTFWGAFQLH